MSCHARNISSTGPKMKNNVERDEWFQTMTFEWKHFEWLYCEIFVVPKWGNVSKQTGKLSIKIRFRLESSKVKPQ